MADELATTGLSKTRTFWKRCRSRAWTVVRFVYHAVVVLLLLFVVAELFARFGLGLGDPPLTVVDSQVGYMFAPNQEIYRFGCRAQYNAFSMRSDYFPPTKRSKQEIRVMFIGDSVINGGSMLDQSQLATEILKRKLREKLERPVEVGNISAGGWSISNELNYVERFGLFDADVVVIVESSHDAHGDEGFDKLSPDFPMRKPMFALGELFDRYLPRVLGLRKVPQGGPTIATKDMPVDVDDLKQLITLARQANAEIMVAQHPGKAELHDSWRDGHDQIKQAAAEMGISTIELRPYYQKADVEGGNIYIDGIHLTARGQQVLADILEPMLIEKLSHHLSQSAE